MNSFNNFEDMVARLFKDEAEILEQLIQDPRRVYLIHAAMGIAGEAGELLDAVKKHVVYDKELNMGNIIEELGDMEFYMEALRTKLNLTRELTLRDNICKLTTRYGQSYSNQAAQERKDKDICMCDVEASVGCPIHSRI